MAVVEVILVAQCPTCHERRTIRVYANRPPELAWWCEMDQTWVPLLRENEAERQARKAAQRA